MNRLITNSIDQASRASEVVATLNALGYDVGDFTIETEPQEPTMTLTVELMFTDEPDD